MNQPAIAGADEIWNALDTEPVRTGLASRRIHPRSSRNLFLELDLQTRQRTLTLACRRGEDIPDPKGLRTQALDCRTRDSPDANRTMISVILTDPTLATAFAVMVDQVAETIAQAPSDAAAAAELAESLADWQRMFDSLARDGLSPTERRGLFAELLILDELVIPTIGAARAVEGWTGPLKGDQDFQLSGVCLEIKSTSALHPHGFTVNNEHEFDPAADVVLMMVHVSLDERLADGTTLPQLVARIDEQLGGHPGIRQVFYSRLERMRYLSAGSDEVYAEPHYTPRAVRYFNVDQGFPRLAVSDLPEGVGDITYRVTLAACLPFETDLAAVTASLAATAGADR